MAATPLNEGLSRILYIHKSNFLIKAPCADRSANAGSPKFQEARSGMSVNQRDDVELILGETP
jgi:hypothetical protein